MLWTGKPSIFGLVPKYLKEKPMLNKLLPWAMALFLWNGCDRGEEFSGETPETEKPKAGYELNKLESSPYKGYEAINDLLMDRVVEDDSFQFNRYFEERPESSVLDLVLPGLKQLLGTYEGNGLESGYRSADPNAINSLLWYIGFSGFSEELGSYCTDEYDDTNLPLKDSIKAHLDIMCEWPEVDSNQMKSFWFSLVRFDAPPREYESWSTYFLSDESKALAPAGVISEMVVAAFYNPHVLIKK
jgi:hypothetical protein